MLRSLYLEEDQFGDYIFASIQIFRAFVHELSSSLNILNHYKNAGNVLSENDIMWLLHFEKSFTLVKTLDALESAEEIEYFVEAVHNRTTSTELLGDNRKVKKGCGSGYAMNEKSNVC